MKIITRIQESTSSLHRSEVLNKDTSSFDHDPFKKEEWKKARWEESKIKNFFSCHSFIYGEKKDRFGRKGEPITFIEFDHKEKEYYQQQLQKFPKNKWVTIEIDESQIEWRDIHFVGAGDTKMLRFKGRANFREAANEEFRFKLRNKDRAGHYDYRDTRMLLYLPENEDYENLNDYVAPYLTHFIFDHPDKQSFNESNKYIKFREPKYYGDKVSQEEYVVNFKDIHYKHVVYGNTGDILYQIFYEPNRKVIRKVGEEVPNKETPNEGNKNLKALRQQAREKIEKALNQEPIVFASQLSNGYNNWVAMLELTESEPEIKELRDKVINEIAIKRQAQQGKRKRNEENGVPKNDTPNKKIKIADNDKENYDFLKNGISNDIEDSKLKSGLEVAIRMEGEKDYDSEKTRKEIEEELWKRNPQLCQATIIQALKERLNDNEVSVEELSPEVKQLINGEITDKDKFTTVKEQAVQEIGQKGAESKWVSLFNKAKLLLEEAQKNITEKLKKDIKLIQDQIKSFKSGANSYLASFYNKEQDRVEKLENSLNTALNQNQTGSEPNKTPWKVIIPIALVSVVVLAVVIVVRRRKRIEVEG